MRRTREILRLRWGEERSLREVARGAGVGATTVRDVIARARRAGLGWPLPEDLDDGELEAKLYPPPGGRTDRPVPDFQRLYRELRRKGVTLELLWQEYRAEHPDDGYGYSRFCDLYRRWRGQLDVVMRQEHRAGEKLFTDWAGMTMTITDPATGEETEEQVFVATLGASNFTYAEVFATQELHHWVAGHVHAYEYMKGVAAITVPDNPRTAVTKADRYEPELHPTYAEMGRYYGTAIIPARVRKPRDKAKVENGVQQVERWVLAPLRDQKFFSRSEANRAVRERLEWLNDRPLSRLDGTRRSLWEEIDRPALRPLPLLRFEVPEWKVSVGVGIDYHVDFHGHYYSVPHALRHNKGRVDVRATEKVVEIFHKRRRVASHRRSRRRGGYTTDRSHMPKSHQKYAEWTPSRIMRWAETIGPETAAMAREVMEHRPHPEQGFRSCMGIIRLAKEYDTERLERACKRARAIGALSCRSVTSILKTGLDQRPVPPAPLPEQVVLIHDHIRGPEYYEKGES
jgi:transposase